MPKISVIHSYPTWLPQTQTWMFNQIRYLPNDIECHVVCERTENLDQFNLPNIHCLNSAPKWRYYLDKSLRKFHFRRHLGFLQSIGKKIGANIIHSHFGYNGWIDLGAIRRSGAKHIVTFYGVDVNKYPARNFRWKKRYGLLFQNVDLILCEGLHMAASVQDLGCPIHKIKVHHLGVSVHDINYQNRVWRPGECLKVLIAASFKEKKGIPYALEALAKLQRDVPLEVTIIGDAASAPESRNEKQKILEAINTFGLKQKTRMLGFKPHRFFLNEAYKHHIFISPSLKAQDGDTEGGAPVSLIEMAATGMPIVSTTHCDIPTVIKNGMTGWLAPERDVEVLVTHLKWWVENPDKWKPMLDAGRRHIETNYSARLQGKKLRNIYKNVLRNECPRGIKTSSFSRFSKRLDFSRQKNNHVG